MGTIEFLDRIKAVHSLPSDYAAANLLGVTRQQVSKYRSGKDFMSDETAIRVAELLRLEPAYVAACIHAERAQSDAARSLWEALAARLQTAGATAAAVILSTGLAASPDASAMARGDAGPTDGVGLYIM